MSDVFVPFRQYIRVSSYIFKKPNHTILYIKVSSRKNLSALQRIKAVKNGATKNKKETIPFLNKLITVFCYK